jgi:hypothetical protein
MNKAKIVIDGKRFLEEEFFKNEQVDGVIRIQKSEFPHIPESQTFGHFYAGNTTVKEGGTYLVLSIKKRGYFLKKKEYLPSLTKKKCFKVICILVKKDLNINNLGPEFFKNSFKNILNKKDLEKILNLRYKKLNKFNKEKTLISYSLLQKV